MKRILAVVFILALLVNSAFAQTISGGEKRAITIHTAGENTAEEGVSPTTGLKLSDYEVPAGFAGLAANGIYFPVLVQISCAYDDKTKANGTGNRAPWGVQYADIIYELPLHANGEVRLSALFSDLIPDAVGPIRSARLGHVWLREEWDCGFMYYGQQEYKGTDVREEVRRTGASEKGLLWPGTSGTNRPWKSYYDKYSSRRLHNSPLKSPNNRTGNPAGFLNDYLIPQWPDILSYPQQINHTYLFADAPFEGGDSAGTIYVNWNRKDTNEIFTYDAATGKYTRFLESMSKKGNPVMWVELESQEAITFDNLIIQWADTTYHGVDAPVTQNVGVYDSKTNSYASISGNADIFMNGRHISGAWQRTGLNVRTVFYGEDGEEIALQRGRTMIIQLPLENGCSYE